jgi:hypothetical protein
LHQIFRVRRVVHHPEAQGVNAAAVQMVEKLKSCSVPGLGQADGFCLIRRLRGLP